MTTGRGGFQFIMQSPEIHRTMKYTLILLLVIIVCLLVAVSLKRNDPVYCDEICYLIIGYLEQEGLKQ